MPRKWYLVLLVSVAIAISYFDRLTLPVAIAAIQHNIPLSNEQFSWLQTSFLLSYAALYAIGGRLLDWLGTRRGSVSYTHLDVYKRQPLQWTPDRRREQ